MCQYAIYRSDGTMLLLSLVRFRIRAFEVEYGLAKNHSSPNPFGLDPLTFNIISTSLISIDKATAPSKLNPASVLNAIRQPIVRSTHQLDFLNGVISTHLANINANNAIEL
jgi:hypothetical protein